ncbi:MAG TPA: VWA domain-containing protein [Terriglobales bacterium]|nr:VWA domain-containing protein [Terriglobales bacterium]
MIRFLRLSLVPVLFLLSSTLFADNLSYLRLDPSIVESRTQLSPQDANARLAMLKNQFASAGCADKQLKEQTIPGQQLPNLVCILPGLDPGAVVVGANYDYSSTGDAARVDWATVSMLPLIAESLRSVPHRYTFILVAFSGHDRQIGSSYYLTQLTDSQRVGIRAMVDLNQIGRGPTMYSLPQLKLPSGSSQVANLSGSDKVNRENVLSKLLPASAKAIKLDTPAELKDAALTDAQSFDNSYILALTVTSAPGPSNAVDAKSYYDTYNLLCLYALVLDRALGPAEAPATTTVVAQNTPPASPAQAASTVPAATPAQQTGSPSANSFERGAGNAQNTITGQMPPAPPNSPNPVVRVSSRLVQVDVVVTDSKGQPIHGLKATDFTIMQDGKPQQLKVFEAHTTRAPQAKVVQTALPSNTYTNLPRDPSDSSWNIIMVDLLNTETHDQQTLRAQLMKLLNNLPPGRQVALFELNRQHLVMLEGFTDRPAELIKAASNIKAEQSPLMMSEAAREDEIGTTEAAERIALEGHSGGPGAVSPGVINDAAQDQMRKREQAIRNTEAYDLAQRVNYTMDAFQTMARTVAGYPGRKNLIWLSGGFPIRFEADSRYNEYQWDTASDYTRRVINVSTQVAQARIAVYPVDIRGMMTHDVAISATSAATASYAQPGAMALNNPSTPDPRGGLLNEQSQRNANEFDAMRDIADQTGGHAFVNSNDLNAAINRSIDDGATYYTLAYTPEKEETIKYHQIEVKLDQANAKLSYRKGYYTEPPAKAQQASGVAALQGAMNPGTPQSTSLYMTVSVYPPDANHRTVRILYNINPNGVAFTDLPNKSKHALVDCMAVAYNSKGIVAAHASDTLDATIGPAQFEQVMSRGLPAEQELDLPPGNYNLRFGVMDRNSQRIGTVDAPVVVNEQVAKK